MARVNIHFDPHHSVTGRDAERLGVTVDGKGTVMKNPGTATHTHDGKTVA